MPAPEPPAAKNHKIEVGRRLRRSRIVRELPLQKTAQQCGTSHSVWHAWEKGKNYPAPWVLTKYCDLYGISMDYLYRGKMSGLEAEVFQAIQQAEAAVAAGLPEPDRPELDDAFSSPTGTASSKRRRARASSNQ